MLWVLLLFVVVVIRLLFSVVVWFSIIWVCGFGIVFNVGNRSIGGGLWVDVVVIGLVFIKVEEWILCD